MNRAYSVLAVKSVQDDKRIISGIATTPTVDRVGDIIEPLGVKFKNPLPLLWQHRHDQPIGTVKFEKPTKDGIVFEAEIPIVEEPGALRDRIEEAWQSIRMGLVRAASIGFRPIEYSYMENGGVRFSEVEVYELSAVTIPANAEAIISTIKSLDAKLRREAGISDDETLPLSTPAATGKSSRVVRLHQQSRVREKKFVIRKINRVSRAS